MKKFDLILIWLLLITFSAFSQGNNDALFEGYTVTIQEAPVNTTNSDFGAAIVGEEILFSSLPEQPVRPKRAGFYDLYSAPLGSGNVSLVEGIETKYHEGPISYCAETGELFVSLSNFENSQINFIPFRTRLVNLKIVVAERQGSGWAITSEFEYNNPDYSVGHPAISPDGNTLIFVSDMPGGKGETDLYMCTRERSGWSEPVNLDNINTSAQEFTPFISSNGILFFASDGYSQNNGLDIIGIEMDNLSSGTPVRLDEPFNSASDDLGLVIHPNGQYGFLTSDRPGGTGDDDIYRVEFTPIPVEIVLELSVVDNDTKELLPGVTVTFNNQGATTSGNRVITHDLEENTTYYIRGTHPDYLDNSMTIETGDESATIRETLAMYKKEVRSFVLENIYYDFDKWDILPQSAEELDKIVLILKENPDLKAELGSHTDSRGSDTYNMELSQKRSESAVDYIISQGIDSSQITARGYGESQLYIENAQTEEEHQMNRRTTFTILEMSSNTSLGTSIE